MPEFRSTYGTAFEMAASNGGGPAIIGLLTLACLLAMLAAAAIRGAENGVSLGEGLSRV
ncbi:hypothetical protein [Amycolatopsis minnesotensis]|uniref:Uncharacterized protein n=1 Tax=Amycolatopsis minnesotensis TaxID=337894 RepID=A0ABN2RJJ5_9PSEU